MKEVTVTGFWLRRRGDKAQMLVEYRGEWRVLCEEHLDGQFSHIVEPRAVPDRPRDPVTETR